MTLIIAFIITVLLGAIQQSKSICSCSRPCESLTVIPSISSAALTNEVMSTILSTGSQRLEQNVLWALQVTDYTDSNTFIKYLVHLEEINKAVDSMKMFLMQLVGSNDGGSSSTAQLLKSVVFTATDILEKDFSAIYEQLKIVEAKALGAVIGLEAYLLAVQDNMQQDFNFLMKMSTVLNETVETISSRNGINLSESLQRLLDAIQIYNISVHMLKATSSDHLSTENLPRQIFENRSKEMECIVIINTLITDTTKYIQNIRNEDMSKIYRDTINSFNLNYK